MFLLPKLNTALATISSQIDEMDGFNMWRIINKEQDPIHKNTKFHNELDIRQLANTKCKNFKETMELVVKLEKKAK